MHTVRIVYVAEFNLVLLKPNPITLAGSELAPNMFGASSELASVMEFGFYRTVGLQAVYTNG